MVVEWEPIPNAASESKNITFLFLFLLFDLLSTESHVGITLIFFVILMGPA
jgi:hypothetical protein